MVVVSNCKSTLKVYRIIVIKVLFYISFWGLKPPKTEKVENLALVWIFEKVAFGPRDRKLNQYNKTLIKQLEILDLRHGTSISPIGTRLLEYNTIRNFVVYFYFS